MNKKKNKKDFLLHIVFPSLFAFILFTLSVFVIIIPNTENNLLNKKRELIKELTNSAWSILDSYQEMIEKEQLNPTRAKHEAKEIISKLRYGSEYKDYFWITDMHPTMIAHPYRNDLNGKDVSGYEDSHGKKLFSEFVKVVKQNGEGFVDYTWQWKDDSTRIVPKLSYVKEFESWGWIVGTGIYIQDVKEEIAELTVDLIYISLLILLVLALVLFYVGKQSFKIESERRKVLTELTESEERYRSLVEASHEGLVMLLDGEYVFCNSTFRNMLGYNDDNLSVEEMIRGIDQELTSGSKYFLDLKSGTRQAEKLEVELVQKNQAKLQLMLFTSEINFGEKSGYTIILKDLSVHKSIEKELNYDKTSYRSLIDNADIGLFRISVKENASFVEVNNYTATILGFQTTDELKGLSLSQIINNKKEWKILQNKLSEKGKITNYVLHITKKDGTSSVFSVSLTEVKNDEDNPTFYDGMLEDITEKLRLDEERENLIIELQTSLRFLNEPILNYVKTTITCNMNTPITKVAQQMTRSRYSAALLLTNENDYIGIITDHDLRERVIAENYDLTKPIFEIMSSPIVYLQSSSPVFQALLFMQEKGIRHLAVKDDSGNVLGMISSEELIKVQRHSSSYLLHEIAIAESVEDVIAASSKKERLIRTLIESGARTKYINQVITSIFDAIVNKLMNFAFDELGEPPVKFSFIALGSIGRKEQTLISDQDNGIVYEDAPDEIKGQVEEYFLKLGNMICDWLNDCGYVYCIADSMAKNPKWCQPFSKWKKYYHSWIVNSAPQDLIDLSIFFDFRCIYGDKVLEEDLRNYLFETTEGQSGFMHHLSNNCLQHKPPIGILGKIIVESKGEHQETFDIKLTTMPIIDFARIYSLKHKIANTNTIERLTALWEANVINKKTYDEILLAYNFIMQLRFKHHSEKMLRNEKPDNRLNPNKLTQIEQTTLKNTLTQIVSIQKRLSYDFGGDAI